MADEINKPDPVTAEAAPAAVAVPEKKRRQPRRAKALADGADVVVDGQMKQRRKRTSKAAQPVETGAGEPAATARGRGRRAAKPTEKAALASAPVSAADEMVDLLQLEEENKRLRQTLAEKLRAENVDLRKRLGLS